MDILICGACKSQYSAVEEFIRHKKYDCTGTSTDLRHARGIAIVPEQSLSGEAHGHTEQLGSPADTVTSFDTPPHEKQASLSCAQSEKESASNLRKPNAFAESNGKRRQKEPEKSSPDKSPKEKLPRDRAKPKQYIKQFKCSFVCCNFVTAHQKDLQRHERTHTGERPYACQYCSKKFSRNDKKKVHERQHTGEKPYRCHICQYKCADGGSLKKHMRIHRDERPFQCQLCSYASRNSSQLVVHLRRHTGDSPFHCQHCEAKFKTNTDLKRHLPIHTGEKPFSCDHCDYRSHLKCNVKSHMASNHMGQEIRQCDDCNFTCRTQKQLNSHVALEHANQSSSFRCVTTASKGTLNKHSKRHSSQAEIKCKFCQYTAKNRSTVSAHVKKEHLDISRINKTSHPASEDVFELSAVGEQGKLPRKVSRKSVSLVDGNRPYNCSKCNASFVREDSLRSHYRQHKQVQETRENAAYAVLQLQDPQGVPDKEQDNQDVISIGNVASDIVVTTTSLAESEQSLNADSPTAEDLEMLIPLPSCMLDSTQGLLPGTSAKGMNRDISKSGQTNGKKSMSSLDTGNATCSREIGQMACTARSKADDYSLVGAGLHTQQLAISECLTSSLPDVPGIASNPKSDSVMSILTNQGKHQSASSCVEFTQLQLCPRQTTMQVISKAMSNAETLSNIPSGGCPVEILQGPAVEQVPVADAHHVEETFNHQNQTSVVQTQTLGYGTSNIPVLLTSATPSIPSAVVLPGTEAASQTLIINSPTSQSPTPILEGINTGATHSSSINLVSVANVHIAAPGSVRLIYADAFPTGKTAVLSSALVQQVPASQQEQLHALQSPVSASHPSVNNTRLLTTSPNKGKLLSESTVVLPQPPMAALRTSEQLASQLSSSVSQPTFSMGRGVILKEKKAISSPTSLDLQPSITILCTPVHGSQ